MSYQELYDFIPTATEPMHPLQQFAVPIRCPGCGQVGHTVWEENMGSGRPNHPRRLLRLSNGFRTDPAPTPAGGPRIVCDHCDAVVPDSD